MKRFGLIGNPISHSRSPFLFKEAYPGSNMTYELIEAGSLDESIEIFLNEYDAVNVTAPYKDDAFQRASSAAAIARKLGTTNLLKKKGGRIVAYNTDYTAAKSILERHVDPLDPPSVLVVGCGGAGKAATLAARDLHCSTSVANRDFQKAQDFCFSINGVAPLRLDQIDNLLSTIDILIYTLPVPLKEIVEADFSGKTVIEANYKDPCLSFLEGKDDSSEYVSGLEWLVSQALAGFEIMTGIVPDEKRVRASAINYFP